MNSFEHKMFKKAYEIARESDFPRFKVGCVITYKNKIIATGCNSSKTHPQQKIYNRQYREFNRGKLPIMDSVHAEMRALNSIEYTVGQEIKWNRVKVFVYRICPGKKLGFGLSKPCPACMNALIDKGIRNIYYTTDDGFAYEELKY